MDITNLDGVGVLNEARGRDILIKMEEINMKMELMDWKQMERAAEMQIRNGLMDRTIGNILLFEAQKKIKELGGQTNEEIDKEAKEQAK